MSLYIRLLVEVLHLLRLVAGATPQGLNNNSNYNCNDNKTKNDRNNTNNNTDNNTHILDGAPLVATEPHELVGHLLLLLFVCDITS